MYALIHNNQIKVGPRQYHYGFFNDYLESEGIEKNLPISYDSTETIVISDDAKIVFVVDPSIPSYNSLTEQLAGPFYDITKEPITGQYDVVDRPIDSSKNELKAKVADNRYQYEISGTKVTIQGQEVSVDTDREGRNIWLQAVVLLPEGAVQRFKFPTEQVWLDLTKSDISSVVQAIMQHVQSAFDWESGKVTEIDAANDKASIDAIDITAPKS